uniref:Ig-like domain-containing protein n=1 Tax=Astatotilapia calliptera TaxID=8154 RepID=A0A3P8NT14_ASTCA
TKLYINFVLCFSGQSETVTPSQTIITLVGEDVILPCHLEPPSDAVSEILEWGRPDLDPRFVHVWFEGQDHLVNQNPSYKGRTSLSTEKLKQGDLSLKLSRVKHSDNGRYRCFFPSEHKESIIELLVGNRVVLQCKSAGWYPEPELLWLDGEGNLLSAGPTETLRGPDDLYTVSSRVTVEKKHKNSFTCRVQQRDMKQSRNQTRTGAGKSEEYIKSKTREWVREYRTRELWLGLEALGIQGLGTHS